MNLLDLAVKIGVDDQASSKIEGIAGGIKDKVGSAFATVGKLAAGVGVAAGGAAMAIGTAATQSFASYEQLAGGVKKLYGDSSDTMMQYAMDGAKTAGMSMNEYMEQATGFSAALINSLGGDTEKAAELTDRAMRAMSDNVNTFGSDAESVQNAIMGISRGNFTMLDNLKLGFAGTKEGAQQLVDAANEWGAANGEASDLSVDSFADMIVAIEQVQKAQNIYGTTAKEALTTIDGSIGMVKASWENLLTAFGTGDQNQVQSAVDGIMEGIFGAVNEKTGEVEGGLLNNLLPVVQRVGSAIVGQMPQIAQSVASGFTTALGAAFGLDPSWVESINTKFGEIFDNISTSIQGFADGFSSTIDTESMGSIFENLLGIFGDLSQFLADNSEQIGATLGIIADVLLKVTEVATSVVDTLGPAIPAIVGAVAAVKGFMVFQEIASVITTVLPLLTNLGTIIGTFGGPIGAIAAALGGLPVLIIAVVGAIVAFIATNEDARNAIMKAFEAVVGFFQSIPEKLSTWWENVKKFVSEKWNSFVEWVTGIPQKITEALGNLKDLLIEAGKSIISGLLKGMKQKAEDMFSWVSGIANKISSLKGPLPYDRKVLVENGMALMSGLRGGLQSGFERDVMPYVSDMADAMQGALDTTASVSVPVSYDAQPMTVQSAATVTQDRRVYEALQEILGAMPHGVYLNGDALVGQLASQMNMAMGRL